MPDFPSSLAKDDDNNNNNVIQKQSLTPMSGQLHITAMANQVPSNSVWSAMDYKPPRGRCNYKTSILSSCPCLRFMLHPVKAATSFDCDGCGHHASFHSLENTAEDAVLKKWSTEQGSSNTNENTTSGASKKRRRIAEKASDEIEVFELLEDDDIFTGTARKSTAKQSASRSSRKGAKSANSSSMD